MAPPPTLRALPEELVEEILLRFAPDDPARLVHAALVCKRWRAIVSGDSFHRRFREFHRTPPLLGFVSNVRTQGDHYRAEFLPTCSLLASRAHSRWRGRVADAHHGRVLLHRTDVLVVWDPTMDEKEEVPFPPVLWYSHNWTAAVLCTAGGPCDQFDCRRGPFLIVFVSYVQTPVVCTYSSSTASWSKPISSDQLPYGHHFYSFTHVAHVESESALYFGVLFRDYILKFHLESEEISWINCQTHAPERSFMCSPQQRVAD